MRVIGIDIEPGSSPNSSEQPKYSIVIIDEKGNILEKVENATISKLIRLSWEYKPDLIATDNVYELGDARHIIKILELLPENIDIIQVTYINGEFKDVRELAKEFNLDSQQRKFSPSKTAYISALLALKGVGTKLKLIETKTKIIVSRGRQANAGGMSQNRYKRHIRGLVLRISKQIKEELDKHGFDYDVIVKRSKAGIENATFIVYAPRESLYGIVKKINTHNLKVEIKPIYKMKISFSEAKTSEKPVLVGIDPGSHVGISILDIYGNPVYFESKKNIDREEVISLILKFGKPILIATDVNPIPDSVKKIASKLGAKVYVPEKSLLINEKMDLVNEFLRKYNISIEDDHVRDSLAAVLKVYKDVEKKFNEAQSLIRKIGIDVNEESILSCIIKGNTVSDCVEAEISILLDKEWEKIEKVKNQELHLKENKRQSVTYEEFLHLKTEIENLKRELKRILAEKEEIERKYEELKILTKKDIEVDRRVYKLTLELDEKEKLIQQLSKNLEQTHKEISRSKDSFIRIANGNAIIIRRESNPYVSILNFDKDGISILGERVSNELFLYRDLDFVIVEKQVIEDLKKLYKEKIVEESKKLDLHKLISEYRRNRSKESDLAF